MTNVIVMIIVMVRAFVRIFLNVARMKRFVMLLTDQLVMLVSIVTCRSIDYDMSWVLRPHARFIGVDGRSKSILVRNIIHNSVSPIPVLYAVAAPFVVCVIAGLLMKRLRSMVVIFDSVAKVIVSMVLCKWKKVTEIKANSSEI